MSIGMLDRLPVFGRGLLDLVVTITVINGIFDGTRQILLPDPVMWELVRIFVALLTLKPGRIRVDILQLARNIAGLSAFDVRPRRADALHRRHGAAYGWPKAPADRRHLLTAGLCCGTLLFAASAAQQIGITLNPSTAKAGFLTAMYVVLVPVFGLFLGRRGSARLWLSMVIAVGGLYLLCMKNGFGGIETSDWILLSCAVLFSFQIMTVDHFAPQVDGVRLSLLQFFVVAVESTAAALLFENPTLAEFGANWLPLAYCGVMSSGVAYTLQILGQRDVNPAIASLIMCLESVFSALGGWLLLHQSLSMREVFGCTLIFAAVVLAQLPVEDWLKCRSASRK